MYDYMKKTYHAPYTAQDLMVPIFLNGKQVYQPPVIEESRRRAAQGISCMEPEYKRFSNPHIYKVSLSDKSHRIKKKLLEFHGEKNQSGKE